MSATLIVYPLIFFLGFIGNFGTCYLIARTKDKSMQTATNYYLVSLAVSDLIQLIFGLPFELNGVLNAVYPYSRPLGMCKGRAFITEMTSYASILTITAFSAERWLAICFPFRVQLFSKLSRAVRIIGAIWITAFVSALPVAYFVTINRLRVPPSYNSSSPYLPTISNDGGLTIKNTEFCGLEHGNSSAQRAVINWSFWVFFVAPLLTISLLYVHIGIRIRTTSTHISIGGPYKKHSANSMRISVSQNNNGCNSGIRYSISSKGGGPKLSTGTEKNVQRSNNKDPRSSRKSVIRMLVSVVVAFFVCWLPYHAQRVMTIWVDWSQNNPALDRIFTLVFYISGYFYYANSAVNPILYSLLSEKFRHAFIRSLCPSCVGEKFFSLSSPSNTRGTGAFRSNGFRSSIGGRHSSVAFRSSVSVTDTNSVVNNNNNKQYRRISRAVLQQRGSTPTSIPCQRYHHKASVQSAGPTYAGLNGLNNGTVIITGAANGNHVAVINLSISSMKTVCTYRTKMNGYEATKSPPQPIKKTSYPTTVSPENDAQKSSIFNTTSSNLFHSHLRGVKRKSIAIPQQSNSPNTKTNPHVQRSKSYNTGSLSKSTNIQMNLETLSPLLGVKSGDKGRNDAENVHLTTGNSPTKSAKVRPQNPDSLLFLQKQLTLDLDKDYLQFGSYSSNEDTNEGSNNDCSRPVTVSQILPLRPPINENNTTTLINPSKLGESLKRPLLMNHSSALEAIRMETGINGLVSDGDDTSENSTDLYFV